MSLENVIKLCVNEELRSLRYVRNFSTVTPHLFEFRRDTSALSTFESRNSRPSRRALVQHNSLLLLLVERCSWQNQASTSPLSLCGRPRVSFTMLFLPPSFRSHSLSACASTHTHTYKMYLRTCQTRKHAKNWAVGIFLNANNKAESENRVKSAAFSRETAEQNHDRTPNLNRDNATFFFFQKSLGHDPGVGRKKL